MSATIGSRAKFKFTARVEYVTEELDHAGHHFYMFNIKVIAESEEIQNGPLQWSVIKSEDEFLQTHKVLRHKYGLLKSFQFRNPSTIGNNMFHLTHAMKPRKEKKDEFLSLILVLDPIPDEVSAFLSLDNASFFTVPQADGSAHTAGHGPTFTSSSAFSSHMGTPVATPVKSSSPPYFASTTATTSVSASASGGGGGGSSNRPGGGKSNRHWWQNAGLIVSCLVMFTSAHFVSSVVSSVGKTTGICDEDSIVMVIYTAVSIGLHHQLLFLKARLEVLVVIIALWLYTHRVLGYALGLYLRHKLDPAHTGQFAFHFEWIALRLGLDQNMVVVHGAEWRNPGAFRNTPYLLRIDEASVVFDVMSIYSAVTSNTPIRIKEIRFNTVKLHLEKLSEESLLKAASEQQLVALAADSKARGESINGSSTERVDSTKPNEKNKHALKPGVLNLWAAMGATDAQQEASLLNNVSGQMDSAADGHKSSVVGAVGAAVTKYNPAALIFKGGRSVGNTLGSTLGAGVGMLSRGMTTTKIDPAALAAVAAENDGEGEQEEEEVVVVRGHDEAALQSALEESLQEFDIEKADSFDEYETSPASSTVNKQRSVVVDTAAAVAAAEKAMPGASTSSAPTSAPTNSNNNSSGSNNNNDNKKAGEAAESSKTKKGFGVPYLLDIEGLQLDKLELHAQDFLNASHSSQSSASVIKLKALNMSHSELTKPPKPNSGSSGGSSSGPANVVVEVLTSKGNRRPLYLDDVVWRLVSKLLAELLKNNSIAMMILLTSAAANNATSVVSGAGSLAYSGASGAGSLAYAGASGAGSLAYAGASTGGRLLTRVGSVFVGGGSGNAVPATANSEQPASAHQDKVNTVVTAPTQVAPAPVAGTATASVTGPTTASPPPTRGVPRFQIFNFTGDAGKDVASTAGNPQH